MGSFVDEKCPNGIKFDQKAGNHETIVSSELYTSEAACLNGISSIKKCGHCKN